MRDVIPIGEFFSDSNAAPKVVQEPTQQPEQVNAPTQVIQPDSINVRDFFTQERIKTELQKPEVGFIEGVSSDLRETGAELKNIVDATTEGKQSIAEGLFQARSGQVKAASNIIGRAITSALDAPVPQLGGLSIKQVGNVVGVFAPKGLKENTQEATDYAQKVAESYNKNLDVFNAANPRAGRNFQAVRELSELLPLGTQAGRSGVEGVGAVVGGAVESAGIKKQVPALFGDLAEKGISETASFSNLRGSLQKEATAQSTQIGKLFTDATEMGQNAFIPDKDIGQLASDLREKATKEIDAEAKNLYISTANTLQGLTKGGQPTGILDATGTPIVKPSFNNINEIETLRRTASRASKSTEGGKRFAGGDIARTLDDFLGNGERVTGDKSAVTKWKSAIKARREYGQKFEQPNAIAEALESGTDETVEQAFIGTGRVALNKELGNVYKNTLNALPIDQRETAGLQLRQTIVNRWIKNSAKAVNEGEAISADNMLSQIKNFRTENQTMWKNFPVEEREILVKLEKDLGKVGSAGALDVIANSVVKLARKTRISGGVEVPRIFKPKQVVTVDELLQLTKTKPTKEAK